MEKHWKDWRRQFWSSTIIKKLHESHTQLLIFPIKTSSSLSQLGKWQLHHSGSSRQNPSSLFTSFFHNPEPLNKPFSSIFPLGLEFDHCSPAPLLGSIPSYHQFVPKLLLLLLSHPVMSDSCDPIDGCPQGSPIPGILQARTLEWVAISFSNAWKWKVKVKLLCHVWFSATPWTAAYQAPLSMGFSRQEYWSGFDSSQSHGLWPTGLLQPWDFPGKSTGVGCHCLLQPTSPPCFLPCLFTHISFVSL